MKSNFESIREDDESKEVIESSKKEAPETLNANEKLDESEFTEGEISDEKEVSSLEEPDHLDIDDADLNWNADDLTIDDMENIDDTVENKPWQEVPLPDFVYKVKMRLENYQSTRISRQEQRLDDGTYKGTPAQDSSAGYWSGSRGNSIFVFNPDYIPQNSKMNPEQKTYRDLDVSKIEYKKGEPIFKDVAKDTEKINMSEDRSDNFRQADQLLAEKRGWTIQEAKQYREDNHLTWHERQDMRTIDLIPSAINGSLAHQGGVAFIKHDLERTEKD